MRINMPVSQQNFDFPGDELLVSSTNTKGEITHCNPAFVRVSGYSYEELIGQPHNLIRHPDMPAEAFKDMWRTIGRGEPWTGLVKNRRKNGDHYWVRANVTPILEGGKPRAYMSVRTKPAAAEVAAAEALYAQMRDEAAAGTSSFSLQAGVVRHQFIELQSARPHHTAVLDMEGSPAVGIAFPGVFEKVQRDASTRGFLDDQAHDSNVYRAQIP